MNNQKSITIALIGEPNAGKSTLINALVGQKISIVTHKVQTTRHKIRGVVNEGDTQLVFIDTPGLFMPKRTLEKAIVRAATSSFEEADIVCMLFDINRLISNHHKDALEFIKNVKKPLFAIINKIDLVDKDKLLPLIKSLADECIFQEIIPLSAIKNSGIKRITNFFLSQATEGPWQFIDEEITDQSVRSICEEITREQAFIQLHQELPYSLKVETEKWEEGELTLSIHQTIFVTKDSQKIIALGKGGAKIKEIGRRARMEIAKLIGKRISLYLYIKVREDWIERDFSKYV